MSYSLLIPKLMENRRLIIGLGSGRCGTNSLTHLLNIQEDSEVTHEHHARGIFEVNVDSPNSVIVLCLIDMLGRENKIIGDVCHFWLRYVRLIDSFRGDKRFICLKRDKESTVRSYLSYPVPENNPIHDLDKEGLEVYYDQYYMKAEYYAERYPDRFKIFNMEALNSEEGQRDMLNFVGYTNHKYDVGVKLNQGIDSRIEERGIEVEELLIVEGGGDGRFQEEGHITDRNGTRMGIGPDVGGKLGSDEYSFTSAV